MRVITAFVAHRWLCDHFGHLNVRHYAAAFDDATFAFWGQIGFVADGTAPMPVTLETKTSFRRETLAGTITEVRAAVTRVGGKSIALTFTMHDLASREIAASCDVVEVFIDPVTRQSCPIPDRLRTALAMV